MERKKLFSKPRKKLFSTPEQGGITVRSLICRDCGQVIESAESPSQAYCPNCGGKRLNIKLFPEKINPEAEKSTEKKKLFSDYDSPFELKLKEYSGKSLSKEEIEKTFSEDEFETIKLYSNFEDGNISINESAYGMEKLFSKLTISVTKTLELDPAIMTGTVSKEDVIDKLEEHNDLPKKSIMIIKKAHNLPTESHFSDTWVEDSSIIPDLETEYNNQSFGIEDFIKILRDRYPDAPENIVDILVQEGTIFIDGGKVTIHKK
jgi:DNA-directed RNA polymerase subunit RPC12/RpoP